MTDAPTAPVTDPELGGDEPHGSVVQTLIGRITRLEIVIGAVIAVIMLALVVIEPDILEAPFENERTLLFTAGGTVLAAIAFAAMLWFRVPAIVRIIVLVVPFLVVNWWLISPYFIDDVVDEDFSTSISEQLEATDEAPGAAPPEIADDPAVGEPVTESAPPSSDAAPLEQPATDEPPAEVSEPEEPAPTAAPTSPVLLGAGQFVGLAGHSGTGDAGIFQNPDGSLTLRFENFDIDNGPDLEVYLVPGADQTSLAEGSIHLGALKGNIGDQNYELSAGTELTGDYTVLVWCEAFSVEFVGATVAV